MTPMQLGTSAETEIFMLSVAAGAFLGVIYGLFAVIRHTVRAKAVRFICDLLYALMFGAVFFVFSLAQTDYIRFFALVGMILGAAMWHFAVGRFAVMLTERILNALCGKIVMPIIVFIHKLCLKICGAFVKNSPILKK